MLRRLPEQLARPRLASEGLVRGMGQHPMASSPVLTGFCPVSTFAALKSEPPFRKGMLAIAFERLCLLSWYVLGVSHSLLFFIGLEVFDADSPVARPYLEVSHHKRTGKNQINNAEDRVRRADASL